MAVTMEDLYQTSPDLFVSGMAAGGSKVAVFSFGRYHPHIKIHPGNWFEYGYGAEADDYSYYEMDAKLQEFVAKCPISSEPPSFESMTDSTKAEFLRRCGKIVVHELGHLYGLGHCIFNRCIMMGTGHLVEDFQAPFHLCPVCLRKLQWRLGFSLLDRYRNLAESFQKMNLTKEERWTRKQIMALEALSRPGQSPRAIR
jgi:archaemetzincin